MAKRADPLRTGGTLKVLSDTLSVFQIYAVPAARNWYWHVVAVVVFPLPLFYVFQAIAPDDPAVARRLLAGTLIFGVSMSTAMFVGQQLLYRRFAGHLKLLITMPVSKNAFVFGTLLYTSLMGAASALILLGFGVILGAARSPTWALAPVLVLTVLTLAGLVMVMISFAPSLELGNILASFVAIVLVLISPVYYTMEAAPLPLQWVGYVSPLRYAADGIAAALGGRADVWVELAVLAASATVTMSLGLWRLPWRER